MIMVTFFQSNLISTPPCVDRIPSSSLYVRRAPRARITPSGHQSRSFSAPSVSRICESFIKMTRTALAMIPRAEGGFRPEKKPGLGWGDGSVHRRPMMSRPPLHNHKSAGETHANRPTNIADWPSASIWLVGNRQGC
jgi:hypothetical protein